jgi:excisionase family DNA binding protein
VSPYLTVQEVAELARCEHKAVRRAIRQGALRAFQPAKWLLIREDDARAWIESRMVVATPTSSPALPSARSGSTSRPRVGSVAALREMEREAAGA